MRIGAQIPQLSHPSGETSRRQGFCLPFSMWISTPGAHSGIWLDNSPSIHCLSFPGSFSHVLLVFSDTTLQIKLLALKSLTECLLLGKPNFDTRMQTLNHCSQAVEENSLLSPAANSQEGTKGWKPGNQGFSLNTSPLKCSEPQGMRARINLWRFMVWLD